MARVPVRHDDHVPALQAAGQSGSRAETFTASGAETNQISTAAHADMFGADLISLRSRSSKGCIRI
jgi:hypothetical protein